MAGRRSVGGLVLGFAALAAVAGCGDEAASSTSSAAPVAVIAMPVATTAPPPTASPDTTASASETTVLDESTVLTVDGGSSGGYSEYMGSGYMTSSSDYIGEPLEEVLSRTAPGGLLVHVRSMPGWGGLQADGGPGWIPAPWCGPSSMLRVTMQLGDAVGVAMVSRSVEPFGGLGVQPLLGGYAEGTPFTVLVVQVDRSTTSVSATFADGSVDSAELVDGLVVLAAPSAPEPAALQQGAFGPTPDFTLTIVRNGVSSELAAADIATPTDQDYEKFCSPPTELPAPGEQPADAAAAEQSIRDAFAATFDFERRASGDKTWMENLDSTEGVQAAIDEVLTGPYKDAAGSADYTMNDLVFTSPTEAWFSYDLFANDNHFDDRFGVAHIVEGSWKIARGVLCQDLALGGGTCLPATGQLYPPES